MAGSTTKAVVDDAIPLTPRLRAALDVVEVCAGREIDAAALATADILLVRSITRVDEGLLANSPVRFVGSATAGCDHVDRSWLSERGIAFTHAPGSNAQSVVEYVLSAIALEKRLAALTQGACVGIVGLGAIGSALASRIQSIGGRVKAFDPWITRWPPSIDRVALEEIWRQPIVCLHADLHDRQPHPSRGLLDTDAAEMLKASSRDSEPTILISAARGELIEPAAFSILLESDCRLVIDTWPGEPDLSEAALDKIAWITPHIAGHSVDAKYRGADMLAKALERWSGKPSWAERCQDQIDDPVAIDSEGADPDKVLEGWLAQATPIQREDRRLREQAAPDVSASIFDALRRSYQQPREWSGRGIGLTPDLIHLSPLAAKLGLSVVETTSRST